MKGVLDVLTTRGAARLTWHGAPPGTRARPAGLLLLGHGAGGGISTPDLIVVGNLAGEAGYAVGLVEQPYRVAGRRAPAPAAQLDEAFIAVANAARKIAGLAGKYRDQTPVIVGGRSSGARVACRSARAIGARGVLALAFPLQPPRPPGKDRPNRLPELLAAGVPILVVQGERDPFGSAADVRHALAGHDARAVTVSEAPAADHALRRGINTAGIAEWLAGFLP
jgi:predicted alpha/beta-hydrolase family hydrolase